ncbi:probable dolichyl pyrophosphate Man9GlcNAc2 alpha-1,3-glucosyltransferase isoform X1 [Cephus cinctus]|uniref:Alpha-1,3-glucosyltransferase n=1 Tax=Cephus cinctus TaxID=211228 RepID=A0AAJ7FI32_CEPCN|nr:probable dolichyl pyrophosphate Man9GlcNAc2 alpha-1,3-glucosyltransferase isoform X1 [Cephus cinctus]XP_015592873.1 probable dolichyl pyrophosphate Man9GlcNAc2 alpha-1,3-glucosyltransferase isoform X1 [Cephus cinctus]XP_015592875.1 probable dolichyl pyrophosphate Man9GlcNAc2 alpha-1,3-glucosyltransferase isoform X1 [Cephus cinctus]XP_024939605.1 probable dolichyl pyrophosphate Man9GlcNAc2 alpha-1,3-glucosyltransferase isoform X1 [Cephus cinctus]
MTSEYKIKRIISRSRYCANMTATIRILVIMGIVLLLRCCVTYHPYSGQGKPPMFGDYEAQRHWQEITLNLPIKWWYTNTTDNDLQYWGLDYPPLTAYHSLLLGYIANVTNSDFVQLRTSRGYESESHKYFMRLSVLWAESITYLPAMLWFISGLKIQELKAIQLDEKNLFDFRKHDFHLATILIYPGLILIDHGHFQYNCASLGFFVAAVTALLRNRLIFGSFLFVLALNYKQMELYHALPIFFYILGNNVPGRNKTLKSCIITLFCVSLTVLLTFAIIWVPFFQDRETFLNVIFRLFPIARGVFEDKVANVWCAINVIYKLRNALNNAQLAQICGAATLLAVLPSSMNLFFRPLRNKFIISLVNSSLGFFLFSFQVHEKSILLVAIPILLNFHNDPLPCFWFLLISTFSMLPLLINDGLYIAYIAITLLYAISTTWVFPNLCRITTSVELKDECDKKLSVIYVCKNYRQFAVVGLFRLSMLGTVVLSMLCVLVKPPKRYPDLFPLLISVYSCGHFIIFFLYFNYKQFCIGKQYPMEKIKSN